MKVHWTSKLPDIAANQLGFASANLLNELAKLGADDVRSDVKKRLDVRSSTLARFFVKGPAERATKAKLKAQVYVGAPKGNKDPQRGNLLVQHDVDGTNVKKPIRSDSLMVPTTQYRRESRNRPRLWSAFKRDMGINTKRGISPRGGLLGAGRRFRTYLIRARKGVLAGRTLLFVRTGVGKGQSDLLYVSRPLIKNPKRLTSRATVTARVAKSAPMLMGREMTRAIASAKQVTRGGGVTSSRVSS
jgi:hypothetical protein